MQRILFGVVIALILAAPLAAGRIAFARYGAYPHNDDFLYARCAQILVDEGRYQHVTQYGSLTASVAAHSIWGAAVCWPVEFSYEQLHLSVALAAWIGAGCLYATGRCFSAPRGVCLCLALTMSVSPYYYGMSFTFMTDVTAVSFVLLAVLGYTLGIHTGAASWRRSLFWTLTGAAAAAAAMWTRQTHLVVILYPLIAFTARHVPAREWKQLALHLLVACGLPLLSYAAYDLGWLLPGNDNRLPRVGVRHYDAAFFKQAALYAYQAIVLSGFVALPVLPLLVARSKRNGQDGARRTSRLAVASAAAVFIALVALFAAKGGRIYITQATGYILTNAHLGPILLADQMDAGRWSDMGGVTWPALVWQVLTVLSFAAVAALVGRTVDRLLIRPDGADRSSVAGPVDDRLVRWCGIALVCTMLAATVGMLAMVETLYDRYWMLFYPFLFPLLAIVLRGRPSGASRPGPLAWTTCGCLIAATFAMSFVLTHDFLAWNRVRGRQVDRWLAEGLAPHEFDAGNGINGWYRTLEDVDTHKRPGDPTLYWRGHAKVALSIGPRPGWAVIDRLPWKSWAVGKECRILVLSKVDPNAPIGP